MGLPATTSKVTWTLPSGLFTISSALADNVITIAAIADRNILVFICLSCYGVGKSPGNAGDTVAPSCRDSLVMGATQWRIVALWSALGDHVADGIVEIRLLDELLQGDVHTVTPVVLRV